MFQFSINDNQFLPHLSTQFGVSISRGQAHILTGENGIGKSTLLRQFYDSSSLKEKIIFGRQKAGELFFDRKLSVYRELLETNSNYLNRELFREFWRKSGLSGKEDRLLSHLSGGEGQLLKILSLATSTGDIYFLDEPGQSLDREKKKLVAEIIIRLLDQQKTLLIVEHDISWLPQGSRITELEVVNQELREKKSWII